MHAIEQRLARTTRRKALLKKAKEVGVIDWETTWFDDRSLNAWETEEHAYISVRVKVDRRELLKYEAKLRKQMERRKQK